MHNEQVHVLPAGLVGAFMPAAAQLNPGEIGGGAEVGAAEAEKPNFDPKSNAKKGNKEDWMFLAASHSLACSV